MKSLIQSMSLAHQIEEFQRLDAEAKRLINLRNEIQAALIDSLDNANPIPLEGCGDRSEASFSARVAVVPDGNTVYVAVMGAEPEPTPMLERGLSIRSLHQELSPLNPAHHKS